MLHCIMIDLTTISCSIFGCQMFKTMNFLPLTFVSPVSPGRWEDDIQKSRQAVIPALVGMMKDCHINDLYAELKLSMRFDGKKSMEFSIK